MINVEHLTKRYAATTAIEDLSFTVARNAVVGFLGPNGAGKSTTLRILTGYLSATGGTARVDGHDVYREPEAVKRVVGYLPENVPLYGEQRVEEYLAYRAQLKGVPRGRRRKAIDDAIGRCALGDVRRRIIGQLSKGYRQRVGLADALVGDPKLLVLDEPTIGLDPNQIRLIRELIRELGRERTVILSSHILPEVEAVCSEVLIINKGRIVGQGRPDELRASLSGGRVAVTVELRDPDGRAAAVLGAVPGVFAVREARPINDGLTAVVLDAEPGYAVRERIFEAAAAARLPLAALAGQSFSLESIFVEITTREEHDDGAADAGKEVAA